MLQHTQTHTTTNNDTHHTTPHGDRDRDRDRERQRQTETERQRKRDRERETRQDKTREERRSRHEKRQDEERDERIDDFFFEKCCKTLKPAPDELAQNVLKKKKITLGLHMIRIRFIGPGELIQNGFSDEQYSKQETCCWHPVSQSRPPHENKLDAFSRSRHALSLPCAFRREQMVAGERREFYFRCANMA